MDKTGDYTCPLEYLDDSQIIEMMGSLEIDCKKCSFYQEHVGKEEEDGMIYTYWTGFLNKYYEPSIEDTDMDTLNICEVPDSYYDWCPLCGKDQN